MNLLKHQTHFPKCNHKSEIINLYTDTREVITIQLNVTLYQTTQQRSNHEEMEHDYST